MKKKKKNAQVLFELLFSALKVSPQTVVIANSEDKRKIINFVFIVLIYAFYIGTDFF